MTIGVLLADDHQGTRAGLRRVLEEAREVDVIGEAGDGLEAILQTEILHPQVVLMDVSMPVLSGLEAARRIKGRHPSIAVVFLTIHESEEYFLEALRCGAEGYLPKSAEPAEVVDAVQCAARGQVYIHPSIARFLIDNLRHGETRERPRDAYDSLTSREREVLVLIGQGLTNQEIARRLLLSPHTVHWHRTSLMQKLGLHDRLDLFRYCVRRGLIDARAEG